MSESSARDARQASRWFLASVAFWMAPHGIQTVVLPYLMAIELNQSAGRFGLTQMLSQAPLLIFLLVGGWVADRMDTRRWLMRLQALAALMPLLLAWAIWRGYQGEALVLLYGAVWGVMGAFVLPARDGLLGRVAGGNIQRMVLLAIGTQFAAQMAGQVLAGRAAQWGMPTLLALQSVLLILGALAAARLPAGRPNRGAQARPVGASEGKTPAAATACVTGTGTEAGTAGGPSKGTELVTASGPGRGPDAPTALGGVGMALISLWRELMSGWTLIASTPVLRATYLITIGMGVFFGGVFLVLMPLAVRDLYQGGAQDLSRAYIAFGLGSLLAIFGLGRAGGTRWPGRVLVFSQILGALVLLPIALAPPAWVFYALIFVWGMGGGFAVSMSRTIMQEQSPASHQSRVMAALSISTAGGGPLGALLLGWAVAQWGVRGAVAVPVLGALGTTGLSLALFSILGLRSRSHA